MEDNDYKARQEMLRELNQMLDAEMAKPIQERNYNRIEELLYKYDKAVLNSDRRFYRYRSGLELTDNDLAFSYVPEFDTYGIDNWTDVLSQPLRERLAGLPEVQLKPLRSRPHPQKPTPELRKKKPSGRPSDNKTPAEILREYIG